MRTIYLALILCCLSISAQAQQVVDIKDTVEGRTFWHERFPERYYFGKDGLFFMQYMSGSEAHEAGAVREGTWSTGESNRLCWMLKDEGINRCYDLSENLLAHRPWYHYDNVYELKEAGQPANILWNRWMHGNLITKPEVYKTAEKPILDEQAYKTAMVGKVMKLPLINVYHYADGRFLFVRDQILEKAGAKLSSLEKIAKEEPEQVKTGTWEIKDGRQCYTREGGYKSCMMVLSARDLHIPQEGWVHILDDNFIRLIKPSDFITVK